MKRRESLDTFLWRQWLQRHHAEAKQSVKLCDGCGKNYADYPSKLCPGCEAFKQHQS